MNKLNRTLSLARLADRLDGQVEIDTLIGYDECHCYHSSDRTLTADEVKRNLAVLMERGLIGKKSDAVYYVTDTGKSRLALQEAAQRKLTGERP